MTVKNALATTCKCIFVLVKIAPIFDGVGACGKEMAVKVDEIIVGHAGDIVHYELIGLCLLIRKLSLVVRRVDVFDVMGKDR